MARPAEGREVYLVFLQCFNHATGRAGVRFITIAPAVPGLSFDSSVAAATASSPTGFRLKQPAPGVAWQVLFNQFMF
jgi:hypothetical protein